MTGSSNKETECRVACSSVRCAVCGVPYGRESMGMDGSSPYVARGHAPALHIGHGRARVSVGVRERSKWRHGQREQARKDTSFNQVSSETALAWCNRMRHGQGEPGQARPEMRWTGQGGIERMRHGSMSFTIDMGMNE